MTACTFLGLTVAARSDESVGSWWKVGEGKEVEEEEEEAIAETARERGAGGSCGRRGVDRG